MGPIVAIVGRPNVGKSTLFNRLIKRNKAIIESIPGVTRDRNYEFVDLYDRPFMLVDTGGFEPEAKDGLLAQMREQSQLAVEEATVIIHLVDGKEGLCPADTEISLYLRQSKKPLLTVVNKIDVDGHEPAAWEFSELGVDRLFFVSSTHGRGIPELVESIVAHLPDRGAVDETAEATRIAVIGRPNVGKSTLINKFLGYDRVIANPKPGTTRDTIDAPFTYHGEKFVLVDTAGIRRRKSVSEKLEKYTVMQALRAIERADIVLMLLDASDPAADQDARVAGYAHERGKATIILLNKWDLLEKDDSTLGVMIKDVRDAMKYNAYAPILTISGLTGQRVSKVMEQVIAVRENWRRRVTTGELNRLFEAAVAEHPPPIHKGRRLKLYYATQASIQPPTFVVFANYPEAIHFSYERYLLNRLREEFDFSGAPIRIFFRGKEKQRQRKGAKSAAAAPHRIDAPDDELDES